MTEDELIEAMFKAFRDECDITGFTTKRMRAALRIARPAIRREALEEAAKVADSCIQYECSPAYIASAIRKLSESRDD